jgi:hypothetical protein
LNSNLLGLDIKIDISSFRTYPDYSWKCLETFVVVQTGEGSFESAGSSLRELPAALRMTE